MLPRRGDPDLSHQEEAPGETQDMLEVLVSRSREAWVSLLRLLQPRPDAQDVTQ